MTEKTSPVEPLEARLGIPDVKGFDQIVEVAKKASLFGFPKKALDDIYLFWRQDLPGLAAMNLRMDKALQLEGIPQAELTQAQEYHGDRLEITEAITANLQKFFAKPADRTWKDDGKPIHQAIQAYEDRDDVGFYEDSITALLEAIVETKGEWKTEPEMRQLIAQHAIEELWDTCRYEEFNYAAGTETETLTIDNIDQEKDEFISALRGEMWTEAETADHKQRIRALKRAIEEIDDGTYSDYINLLWKTAIGKGAKKTTAIDVVITTEELFQDLKNEGALEWDPDEEFEEDEE